MICVIWKRRTFSRCSDGVLLHQLHQFVVICKCLFQKGPFFPALHAYVFFHTKVVAPVWFFVHVVSIPRPSGTFSSVQIHVQIQRPPAPILHPKAGAATQLANCKRVVLFHLNEAQAHSGGDNAITATLPPLHIWD